MMSSYGLANLNEGGFPYTFSSTELVIYVWDLSLARIPSTEVSLETVNTLERREASSVVT